MKYNKGDIVKGCSGFYAGKTFKLGEVHELFSDARYYEEVNGRGEQGDWIHENQIGELVQKADETEVARDELVEQPSSSQELAVGTRVEVVDPNPYPGLTGQLGQIVPNDPKHRGPYQVQLDRLPFTIGFKPHELKEADPSAKSPKSDLPGLLSLPHDHEAKRLPKEGDKTKLISSDSITLHGFEDGDTVEVLRIMDEDNVEVENHITVGYTTLNNLEPIGEGEAEDHDFKAGDVVECNYDGERLTLKERAPDKDGFVGKAWYVEEYNKPQWIGEAQIRKVS